MKELDPEELLEFDGKDGKPVYIAHKGKVYDVSSSTLWKGGLHMKRHKAGRDLTTDIQAAPHGVEVFERFPQSGILGQEKKTERAMPACIAALLDRFPMMRRHPHPMTVHFPIAFMIMIPVFNILYLISDNRSFETTAFHCLAAGLIFTPVVAATGFFSWWLNYNAKPLRPISIKQWLSAVMFIAALAALVWRLAVPDVMTKLGIGSVCYFVLTMSLAILVMVIGWHGAKLTFPIESE